MRTHSLVGWAVLGLVATTPVLVQLGPAATAARPFTCHGATATIVGTPGDDTLTGTPGRDVIVGRGGDDRVRGLGGNDVLCGNVGADVIQGGPGDDRVYGGTGVGEGRHEDAGDVVYDGDLLQGGPGDDHLDLGYEENPYGGGTMEVWESVSFAGSQHGVDLNLVKGTARGQGHDTVVNARFLLMLGTRHDDTFRGGPLAGATFYGGAGDDKVIGSEYGDRLYPGHDSPFAFRGLASKIGVGGRDAAYGRAGDDRIEALEGGGGDTLNGGPGADHLTYQGSAPVHLDAGTGDDEASAWLPERDGSSISVGPAGDTGDKLYLRPPNVRKINWDMTDGSFLIDGADRDIQVAATPWVWLSRPRAQIRWTINGTDLADYLFVTSGRTTFHGRGGDDSFRGDAYDDVFDGGDGDDIYVQDLGGTNTCVSVEHDPHGFCAS